MKNRIISLVVCAALLLGLVPVYGVPAAEAADAASSDYVVTRKTVAPNDKGGFTVTVYTYTTGIIAGLVYDWGKNAESDKNEFSSDGVHYSEPYYYIVDGKLLSPVFCDECSCPNCPDAGWSGCTAWCCTNCGAWYDSLNTVHGQFHTDENVIIPKIGPTDEENTQFYTIVQIQDGITFGDVVIPPADEEGNDTTTMIQNLFVQDEVDSNFTIDTGTVKIYSADYDGTGFGTPVALTSADGVTSDLSGNTITVKGFPFYDNCVAEGADYGKQLIVSYDISPQTGVSGLCYIGTDEAGVYRSDSNALVENFENPQVNVGAVDEVVNVPDMVVDKKVEANADGKTYKVTLTAYAKKAPTDIVLVLDSSSSTTYALDTTTIIDALKAAAIKFVEDVDASATETSTEYNISLITFAQNADVKVHLTDENNTEAVINAINGIEPPKMLSAEDGTMVNKGLQAAVDEFESYSADGSNRVVVVFTDGIPGTGRGNVCWGSVAERGASQVTAENALSIASTLKQTYGADIYTIGLMYGLNSENSLPSWTAPGECYYGNDGTEIDPNATAYVDEHYSFFHSCHGQEYTETWNANYANVMSNEALVATFANTDRFLHLLSSNYPKAIAGSLANGATYPDTLVRDADGGYYQSATTAAGLSNTFTRVAENVKASSMELDSITQLQDWVNTNIFAALPDSIEIYTAAYTKANGFGEWEPKTITNASTAAYGLSTASIDTYIYTADVVEDGTNEVVTVSGFDFTANSVTPSRDGGYQLIVTYDVDPDDAATGLVPVDNQVDSGVYYDTQKIAAIPTRSVTLSSTDTGDSGDGGSTGTGLELAKNAVYDSTTGLVTITMEAYATGTASEGGVTAEYLESLTGVIPADFVNNNTNFEFWIRDSQYATATARRAYYCSGEESSNSHEPGWFYYSTCGSWQHVAKYQYTPVADASDVVDYSSQPLNVYFYATEAAAEAGSITFADVSGGGTTVTAVNPDLIAEAVLMDWVTGNFDANTIANAEVTYQQYTGSGWEAVATPEGFPTNDDIGTDGLVSVTGFNYAANAVADGVEHGYKMIVTFTVKPIDGLTGTDIATNTEDSGIYVGDAAVKYFTPGTVTIEGSGGSGGGETGDNDDTDGLELNKYVTESENGYTITLEAYTTGQLTESGGDTTTGINVPTDIYLVLDRSSSMSETFGAGNDTIMAALKESAQTFIEELDKTGGHRISIVTFAKEANYLVNLTAVNEANAASIISTINGITPATASSGGVTSAEDGTQLDEGMRFARNEYLAEKKDGTAQNSVVIVFTDGIPGNGQGNTCWSGGNAENIANGAMQYSADFDQDGVRVYTVALINGLTATDFLPSYQGYNPNCLGGMNVTGHTCGLNTEKTVTIGGAEVTMTGNDLMTNRYLHLLSSNYPNARRMDDLLDTMFKEQLEGGDPAAGYYISASSASDITNAFQSITSTAPSSGVAPIISLGATTVVRDILTEQFDRVSTSDVRVYLEVYNGAVFSGRTELTGVTVTWSADGKTVDISGFDFNKYCVVKGVNGGGRLVVEIDITADAGAIGRLPTNEADSGVYKSDDTLLERFERPTVLLMGDTDALKMNKTAVYNETDENYTITLEAYTTGTLEVVTETTTTVESVPTDIYLVLDRSSSMSNTITGTSTTILAALQNAAKELIAKLDPEAGHRVSVITFAGEKSDGSSAATVEMGITEVNASNIASINGEIEGIVLEEQLATTDGTMIGTGLVAASNARTADVKSGDPYNENAVVIVFTDGIPGNGKGNTCWSGGEADLYAHSAIRASWNLKNEGIDVYVVASIGDMLATDNLPDYYTYDEGCTGQGLVNHTCGLFDAYHNVLIDGEMVQMDQNDVLTNRFLHLLSSNYPNAEYFNSDEWGAVYDEPVGDPAAGYYMAASSAADIANAFVKISESITTSTTTQNKVNLNTSAIITDTVSQYFTPDWDSLKVYTAPATGGDATNGYTFAETGWTEVTENVTASGDTLVVTGHSFVDNVVMADTTETDGVKGAKLIIQFNVTPKDGFVGGNAVPTNDSAALYLDNELLLAGIPIREFDVPKVNVALNFELDVEESATVHYGADVDPESLYTKPYTDGWEYDYVTVTYENQAIAPESCGDYDVVKVEVKSKHDKVTEGPDATSTEVTGRTAIHVLTPNLSVTDVTIYESQSVELEIEQGQIGWTCGHQNDLVLSAPMTEAPEVTCTFTPAGEEALTADKAAAYAPTDCTEVTVTPSIGDEKVGTGDSFTVHVLQPTISAQDTTIYLTQSVDLSNVKVISWSDKNRSDSHVAPAVATDVTEPVVELTLTDSKEVTVTGNMAYAPTDCVTVTVAAATEDGTYTFTGTTFDIHVVQPTVKAQDLWADYGARIELTNSEYVTVGWGETCGRKHDGVTAPSDAPKVSVSAFSVDEVAQSGTTYTMGDKTVTVQITALKIVDGNTESTVVVKEEFTININTFDLVIVKEFTGAGAGYGGNYAQEVIFKLTDHVASQSIRITGTNEKTDGIYQTKVTGLICGKSYTLTEETDWSWRYELTVKDGNSESRTVKFSTSNHGVSTSDPNDPNRLTTTEKFENELTFRQWLSAIVEPLINIFK